METHLELFLRLFCYSTALFTLHFNRVLIEMLFTISMCCLINFYKGCTSIYLVLMVLDFYLSYKLLLDIYVHLKFSRISYLLH